MRLLNVIVFSNIWISFGAVGTTVAFYLMAQNNINYLYLCLVFFSTLFGYNLQYLSGHKVSENRLNQSNWLSKNKFILKIITIGSLVISFSLSLYILPFKVLVFSLPAFFLVFFYKKGKLNSMAFRNIPLIKILIIAFCWMWACSIVPQLLSYNTIHWKVSLFVFFFVLTITLPFDIRDYHFDKDSLITVPNLIGVRGTYFLSLILLGVLSFMALFYYNFSLFAFVILTLILMIPSYKSQKEFYYLIVLDGLLLVFPIFVK